MTSLLAEPMPLGYTVGEAFLAEAFGYRVAKMNLPEFNIYEYYELRIPYVTNHFIRAYFAD